MPGYNGRGPNGEGPKTGRGLGYCGTNVSRSFGQGRGRGLGQGLGRGMGRGMGRGFGRAGFVQSPELTEAQERAYLQQELEAMELAKPGIEKRLKELKP